MKKYIILIFLVVCNWVTLSAQFIPTDPIPTDPIPTDPIPTEPSINIYELGQLSGNSSYEKSLYAECAHIYNSYIAYNDYLEFDVKGVIDIGFKFINQDRKYACNFKLYRISGSQFLEQNFYTVTAGNERLIRVVLKKGKYRITIETECGYQQIITDGDPPGGGGNDGELPGYPIGPIIPLNTIYDGPQNIGRKGAYKVSIQTYENDIPGYSSDKNYVATRTYTDESGIKYLDQINYFDGLGRPVQSVQRKITSGTENKDLISLQTYDAFGRKDESWLPGLSTADGGYVDPTLIKQKAKELNSGDQNPYSKPVYEQSPLNRVLAQYGPGASWHNNGKAIRSDQMVNSTTVDSLKCTMYKATGTGSSVSLSRQGFYPEGALLITRMMDEDNNRSYEFKDKLGRVVLTRQMNGSEKFDTYYVYDIRGNLSYVLPPLAVDKLTNYADDNDLMKQYAYLYKYDEFDRCTKKRLPGTEWISYVYDKADRLIFTQDGEQANKSPKEWTFNKYDAFGRLVISGIYKTTQTHTQLIDKYKNTVFVEKPGTGAYYYTWTNLLESDINVNDVLIVNYYDDHNNIPKMFNYDIALKYTEKTGYGKKHSSAKGMLVGSRIKNIDSTGSSVNSRAGEIATAIYYDIRGRVIQTKSTNHLGGVEEEYIAYNFTGQPTQKLHIHKATGKLTQTELYTYTYDHAGRLTETKHKLNNNAEVVLAKNEYDELGRLKSNMKHGKTTLKTLYTYNVRSWTKSISSPLFNQTLYYNDKVTAHTYTDYVLSYNGNISGMEWQHGIDPKQSNRFKYDALSRLRHSAYNGVTSGGNYNTSYAYDKHGNVQSLVRQGKLDNVRFNVIDNLEMTYTGNQLKNVHDKGVTVDFAASEDFKDYSIDATKAKVEYAYNRNGAMVKDLNKGITQIKYNSLNLPQQMDIKSPVGEARNEYTYSAGGAKLRVVHKWNPNYSTAPIIGSGINESSLTMTQKTDYVGNIIYENDNLKRILVAGGYWEGGQYYFYLTDHLGNNRAVVKADGTTVVQKNQYYPFGMSFADRPVTEKGLQPYKYNGKELDQMHGLNTYDYHARQQDFQTGRFTSVDPLAEKYYSWSPYAYCANNPIKFIDPTGMWIQYRDNTGEYRYENNQWMKYNTEGEYAGRYTTYTPEAGSFMEGVLIGLNQLNNNVTGNKLISYFANDDNNAFIVAGSENLADITNSATGTITLNENFLGSEMPTENGVLMSPFWLDIGHELSHRQDVLKNGVVQAGVTWLKNPDTGELIRTTEKYATHMENLMRADAGLPLRTHYVRQGDGGWANSRILIEGTRTSEFYNVTYNSYRRIVVPNLLPSRRK